jgi:hypothetical protein
LFEENAVLLVWKLNLDMIWKLTIERVGVAHLLQERRLILDLVGLSTLFEECMGLLLVYLDSAE